jgi:two-component system nitrogen regulation sensor histidine kinase NtrY
MPKPIFKDNDLLILLKENIKLLQKLDDTIKIELNSNIEKIIFNSDKEQLSRVFFNLIKNSVESIQQKKNEKNVNFVKNISIELYDFDDHISLIINDNGIGFDSLNNNIKEILNPYFTTKKHGTGLGLSIVNKIINDHNGSIEFVSKDDGAIIKVNLSK